MIVGKHQKYYRESAIKYYTVPKFIIYCPGQYNLQVGETYRRILATGQVFPLSVRKDRKLYTMKKVHLAQNERQKERRYGRYVLSLSDYNAEMGGGRVVNVSSQNCQASHALIKILTVKRANKNYWPKQKQLPLLVS